MSPEKIEMGPYWRQVALGGSTGAAERHAKSQLTRRAILEASGSLFAEFGYRAVSLSMVAERSGVSKGSLAFHFSSKLVLAHEVVAEMHRCRLRMWADVDSQNLDPLSSMLMEVEAVIAASIADPIVLGGYRLAQDAEVVADEESHFVVGEQRILQYLIAAAAAGQLAPHIDPTVAARLIIAVISGHRAIHSRHPDQVSLQTRMVETWELLLPTIISSTSRVPAAHITSETDDDNPESSVA